MCSHVLPSDDLSLHPTLFSLYTCLNNPTGIDSGSLTLLDTSTWSAARQWAFPTKLASVGFAPRTGAQMVLAGGMPASPHPLPAAGTAMLRAVKLTLFAAPERGAPQLLQVGMGMGPDV